MKRTGNILITGGNQGIGYCMAKRLLLEGNNVGIIDIETDNLAALCPSFADALCYYTCDVRDRAQIESCVQRFTDKYGSIDIAIHNACICTFDSMLQTPDSVYKDVLDVNYFGALRLARVVIPYMLSQHKGKIMFTSSGVGTMGFMNISPYASSKGAIEALAKCLSLEYQHTGLSFHLLHPPLTRTASSSPLPVPGEFMADPEKVGAGLAKRIDKNSFIICHSTAQTLQTRMMYLFPLAFGSFLSRMTVKQKKEVN